MVFHNLKKVIKIMRDYFYLRSTKVRVKIIKYAFDKYISSFKKKGWKKLFQP